MQTKWIIVIVVAAVVAASLIPFLFIAGNTPLLVGGDYVALLELSGTISYDGSPISLFGRTLTPADVEKMVEQVENDPFAKAVVLVINSPGGSAAASEEIYQMFRKLAEKKPVVAYIAEYGASGGYYIALPAGRIVASPSALTGSVGAVALVINYAELAERLGIRAYVFKSGVMKDVGNPFRELSSEEQQLLQSLIDSTAKTFASRVMEAREGKVKAWDEVLTARPYTGEQALKIGLVDMVGSIGDAVRVARELAGAPEDTPTRWIRPRTPSLLEMLLGGGLEIPGERMKLSYEILLMWPLPEAIPTESIAYLPAN